MIENMYNNILTWKNISLSFSSNPPDKTSLNLKLILSHHWSGRKKVDVIEHINIQTDFSTFQLISNQESFSLLDLLPFLCCNASLCYRKSNVLAETKHPKYETKNELKNPNIYAEANRNSSFLRAIWSNTKTCLKEQ